MPIWFELMVMLLVTYVMGLGIGWIAWGRDAYIKAVDSDGDDDE